jgi:regulatory protein
VPERARARVTALRELRGGRVAVSLDGEAWRTLPADVIVRCGLGVGTELDRERVRTLARELRRDRALSHAARALRTRDRTSAELDARLERAGFSRGVRSDARDVLARAGLVDDERFARRRATELAERGRSDAAIRWDLERRGLPREAVEAALEALEPEQERANRLGLDPPALARRGFSEDVVAFVADVGIGYED